MYSCILIQEVTSMPEFFPFIHDKKKKEKFIQEQLYIELFEEIPNKLEIEEEKKVIIIELIS